MSNLCLEQGEKSSELFKVLAVIDRDSASMKIIMYLMISGVDTVSYLQLLGTINTQLQMSNIDITGRSQQEESVLTTQSVEIISAYSCNALVTRPSYQDLRRSIHVDS